MTPSTTSRNQAGRILQKTVFPLVVWLGVWQLASLWVGKELLLPSPLAVAERLVTLAGTGEFWRTALVSLGRIFGGFFAGALLGSALAVLTSASPWAECLLAPAVKLARAVPVASFIVLVLLWAPGGWAPGIISGLMVLPVLWANVSKGIAQTDRLLLEAAQVYRFGRWKTVALVYLPSVFPYVSSGCSTGLGLAWKAGIAAEVLCQPRPAIGSQVYAAKLTLDTPGLFAWTAVVVVLSLALDQLLSLLFRRAGRGANL